jgi:biopolymer transport protein ExbB
MLLGAAGGRSMYRRWRPAVGVIATARAVALLAALLFPALRQAARADEDASAAAASAVIASLPHDLSPWSMFMNADIVVKATMVGLAFASLITWTVWLAKGLELLITRCRARAAMRILVSTPSLDEAARQIETSASGRGAAGDLVKAALLEMRRSAGLSAEGAKERLAIALTRIEARAGHAMGRGAGLLATIGSTAPFVGLFGTVWGIMNSFIGISRAHTGPILLLLRQA